MVLSVDTMSRLVVPGQTVQTDLRQGALKSILKALHSTLTEPVWQKLFKTTCPTDARVRTAAILSACKQVELGE